MVFFKREIERIEHRVKDEAALEKDRGKQKARLEGVEHN